MTRRLFYGRSQQGITLGSHQDGLGAGGPGRTADSASNLRPPGACSRERAARGQVEAEWPSRVSWLLCSLPGGLLYRIEFVRVSCRIGVSIVAETSPPFRSELHYPKALSHTEAHSFYPQPRVEGTTLPPSFGLGIRGSERLSDLPKAAQLAGGRVRAETPSLSLDRAP